MDVIKLGKSKAEQTSCQRPSRTKNVLFHLRT